jgi:hypothetical protein
MKKINEIFDVSYGNKLDLNKMVWLSKAKGGINFVGRSSESKGISATVAKVAGVSPQDAGLITVALGGSKLLASFVQDLPFYTAQNVAVLRAKSPMSYEEKTFYCICIRHNRFRYSAFGREANRSLKTLLVPEANEYPAWLDDPRALLERVVKDEADSFRSLQFESAVPRLSGDWKTVSDLFAIQYGNSYELCNLSRHPGVINFVSRTMSNNGVSARVAKTTDEPFSAGNLTVALGGNVLETWVQPAPFYTGRDVAVLIPKKPMILEEKLFFCVAIRHNKSRFGYGRQANRTLPQLALPPLPDWVKPGYVAGVQDRISSQIERLTLIA